VSALPVEVWAEKHTIRTAYARNGNAHNPTVYYTRPQP